MKVESPVSRNGKPKVIFCESLKSGFEKQQVQSSIYENQKSGFKKQQAQWHLLKSKVQFQETAEVQSCICESQKSKVKFVKFELGSVLLGHRTNEIKTGSETSKKMNPRNGSVLVNVNLLPKQK